MKHATFGFILCAMLASIALNFAQYQGKLSSPRMVVMEPSDQQKLAAIYGGLDDNR